MPYSLINNTKLNTAEEMKQIIGDLSQLQTEDKSSIVSAINEITISGNIDRVARQLINNEINRATTAEAALSSSISLENDRASAAENVLNTKIIDLKNSIYTKQEADSLLDTKANTSDVYTKQETDRLLDGKVNAADVYTKQEADSLLDDKANAVDVYTKQEADSLLDTKANTSDVYTKQETDRLLDGKVNAADVYTKQEADTKITELIDDSIISTSKTWSSEKIASKTSYPLGFIYPQLYNPTLATWEKSPSQLGMTPASGCRWEEITRDFASFPYLKIGSGTTQSGHNAYHRHTHSHTHSHSHTAYTGCYATGNENAGYGLGGNPGFLDRVMVSAPSNVGTSTDSTSPSTIYTSYNGDSTEQTVEVNASNMKIWKVVADT